MGQPTPSQRPFRAIPWAKSPNPCFRRAALCRHRHEKLGNPKLSCNAMIRQISSNKDVARLLDSVIQDRYRHGSGNILIPIPGVCLNGLSFCWGDGLFFCLVVHLAPTPAPPHLKRRRRLSRPYTKWNRDKCLRDR
jgi:hypothetical protein